MKPVEQIVNQIMSGLYKEEQNCSLCDRKSDTRPYGPGGSEICFDCGMVNLKTTRYNMSIKLFGENGELA